MHIIYIPAGDLKLAELIVFCNNYSCSIGYQDKSKLYFRITTDDPVNFFWLGCKWNSLPINEIFPLHNS
jgi:hypothetical protein